MGMKYSMKISLLSLAVCLGVMTSAGIAAAQGRGPLEVHMINVGDGDAIFIRLPDQTNLLIDAGREEYAEQIIEYLKSQRVTKIHKAVMTHPHNNHFGSFPAILEAFPVEKFYVNGDLEGAHEDYFDLLGQVEQRQIPTAILGRGQTVTFDDPAIGLKVLHPADHSASANGNSLVIWLSYGRTGFLFTADIGEAQQDEVIAYYPQVKAVNCVQVPHHGKDVSAWFAKTFKDKIFIVSTGIHKDKVPDLSPLRKLKGRILRTDLNGTIVVISDGNKVEVRSP